MARCLCIHGHFYQPPRENPWLEAIELQDSAYPYHDWNERITAQCYGPNTASRILDGEGRIAQIVNNFARISFNIGPTLLAWMENEAPDIYEAILQADRESQKRFAGHGSAIAQVYNHMILPLANRRDKYTQIFWGIRDFEHRFNRKPEGMWLPETAVDLESLDIMAELGIAFTILAPHQALRVRPVGTTDWTEVANGRIDPTQAYKLVLPSGRSMALFFYDGPISRAVAFEGLLNQGEAFAHRLLSGFSEDGRPQLVHIATDGESYGHHHPHGDMALAYALHYIEANKLATLTNYGEFLEKYPPTWEVEILENTSWSCAHGVERWRSNCGCNSGGHPGWTQEWRAPLREAMDWLRDSMISKFEDKGRALLKDPWTARNHYIDVILDRRLEKIGEFLAKHAHHSPSEEERTTVLKLLELQRHAMLMYTSCGWFFDELSGIETVQVIQYAGRVVQLAQELFGDNIEPLFVERLERARGNIPAHPNGRVIYEKFVKPAMLDWRKLAAHFAMSSLFEGYGEDPTLYCYSVEIEDYQRTEAGKAKVVAGRAKFVSRVTRESKILAFAALHLGDHNVSSAVEEFFEEDVYKRAIQGLFDAFNHGELPEVVRLMNASFGQCLYSLKHLFGDEQRRVLKKILESSLAGAEALYRKIYEDYAALMRFLAGQGIARPKAFQIAAEFFLNGELKRAVNSERMDAARIHQLLQEAADLEIELDSPSLGYLVARTLEKMAIRVSSTPEDATLVEDLLNATKLASSLPFELDLWRTQNLYDKLLKDAYPLFYDQAQKGDSNAQGWVANFHELGKHLGFAPSYIDGFVRTSGEEP